MQCGETLSSNGGASRFTSKWVSSCIGGGVSPPLTRIDRVPLRVPDILAPCQERT